MTLSSQAVPYPQRCVQTPSGTAVVWPFLNLERGDGPYELFLDTNALSKVQWAGQLPAALRDHAVLNPWPALLEQWLSNPEFRADPIGRIETMVAALVKLNFRFRADFAREQVALLKRNEAALKTQFSLTFPYVAIIKSLLSTKMSAETALERLEAVGGADVPRFTSCLMLAALAVVLKGRQSLKLDGDTRTAYAYMESFLAFQSGKKGEGDCITVPYLRNRAGDLNLWLTLPMLHQHGYRFVGTPAVVTGDKAMHGLILRVLPPVLAGSGQVCFSIQPEGLGDAEQAKILGVVQSVVVRKDLTPLKREQRMLALFELAASFCAKPEERAALQEAWRDWCEPGLGQEIHLA